MKKTSILLLLAAATVLVSCKKDNLGADAVENEGSTVSAVIDDDNSKTTLDGAKVLWTSGDVISINGSKYNAKPNSTDARTAKFTLVAREKAPTTAPFRAFYPTSANMTGNFLLQSTQNYSTNNKISNVNPMYAVSDNLNDIFHFKNVCGLLTLDLKGVGTVSSITISANEYLAGLLTDIAISDDGELTYSAIKDDGYYASKSVTLGCGELGTLDKETARRFYIALPEGDFTGVQITITTDLGTMTIPATKTVSIKKNNIYHLPEMTIDIKPLDFNIELSIDKCETISPTEVDFAFSAVPENKDTYYMLSIENAAYVDQFDDALELARADVAYWKEEGYTSLDLLIEDGIVTKGDLKNISFPYCEPKKDYALYAFAIDESLNVSPAILRPFTTPEFVMPVSDAKYEDYLGQWVMGPTELITISEKVPGSTYNVKGINNQSQSGGYDYNIEAVEATFENGYIVLKEQKTSATVIINVQGLGKLNCDLYLSGVFSQSGKTYGYYPINAGANPPETIFQGRLDGDRITVYPGSCKYGIFESMGFSWVINSGAYKGQGNTFAGTTLADMTRYIEPVGPTPDGKWYCPSVTDAFGDTYENWTLDIAKKGAGFIINDFDIAFDTFLAEYEIKAEPAPASWDPESNTLTIALGTDTGITADETPVLWFGLTDDLYLTDIVLKFDFEANTCTLQTGFVTITDLESEPYSFYMSGSVFTKQAADSAPRSNVAGNKVGKHFNGMNAAFLYPQAQIVAAPFSQEQNPVKMDNTKKRFKALR